MNSRSLIPIGLTALFLTSVPGCKKSDPPAPEREATASSAAPAQSRGATASGNRVDPQTLKNYRLDVCYYGTLTLKQARDSYFASLGKEEPSEKKIPTFGFPLPSSKQAPGATAPTSSAAADKAPPGQKAPAAAAGASAQPAGPFAGNPHAIPNPNATADGDAGSRTGSLNSPSERRAFEFNTRAPYERSARGCNAAMVLKEPQMGDVDTALAAFSTFAVALAKDITAASAYYISEGYKADKLAKGKDLHKQLVDGFQKLDELHEKLGNAIAAWRKDHPVDVNKQDEGEKVVYAAVEDAKDVLMAVSLKKIEGYEPKVEKLDKSISAVKDFGSSHASDPWSKIMVGPFDAFLKAVKDAKMTPTGVPSENLLSIINSFSSVLESRNRANSRALAVKAKALMPRVPASALPPGHPGPTYE
jgi:hypothetical protein